MLRLVSRRHLSRKLNRFTWLSRHHTPPTWTLQSRKISSGIPSPSREPEEGYVDQFDTRQASGERLDENLGSESETLGVGEVRGRVMEFKYGEVLKEGRYRIEGKLGSGVSSQVWLARDLQANTKYREDQFVAIKVLSLNRSVLESRGRRQELKAHTRINEKASKAKHCNVMTLHDSFHYCVRETAVRKISCLVFPLMQASLDDVINSSEKQIPINSIKRVLRSVLKALKFLHQNNIVHKEITPRDVMIKMNPQLDVDKLLSSFPRDVHQIVDLSTLLPRPTLEELADENVKFVLSDFGSAALLDRPSPKEYHSQPSLLPPEILIGDKWDQSVDIWNLGTMAYYLLTRKQLFPSTPTREQLKKMWPPALRLKKMKMFIKRRGTIPESEEWMLYQMSAVCESDVPVGSFPMDLLKGWYEKSVVVPEKKRLFDLQGRLLTFRWPPLKYGKYTRLERTSFTDLLSRSPFPISDEERRNAAKFLKKCVRLNPSARPSAAKLMEQAWFET